MRHQTRLTAAFLVTGLVGCGDNQHPTTNDAPAVDSGVDVTTCTPTTTKLVSVTSGDLTMDVAQAANLAPLTVDVPHSILFTSLSESEPSPNYGAVLCDLHEADQPSMGTAAGISCYRNNAGTDTGTGMITVHWTVATFSAGVTVQRGHADTNVANPSMVPLATAADLDSSFVLLGGDFNGGSGWGNNEFVRARLLDSSTLELKTLVPGTEVAWQVVTMKDAKVQRGTASVATSGTSTTATIASTTDPMLLTTYTTDNASSIAAATMLLRASATSPTELTFTREMSGSELEIAWEAVTLPFVTHTGSTMLATGELTKTENVADLPASSSVALSTNEAVQGQSSGSTTYAGADLDLLGEGGARIAVTDNTLTFTRATAQAAATIDWTAVDFGKDRCSN